MPDRLVPPWRCNPAGSGFIRDGRRIGIVLMLAAAITLLSGGWASILRATERVSPSSVSPSGYTGSVSCRQCHEKFYQLWSPSHHGLAMQPYTAALAEKNLTPQADPLVVENHAYRAFVGENEGYVLESGPDGEKRLPMVQVLGGKYVYYFLTPLDKGRLQTLPVAYDVRRREWFDMAASGVRHFPGGDPDTPTGWRDWPYTFNTACHGCHVSQLSTNYDPKSDTYHTVWTEPGINCETCHGPAQAHIRVCLEAPEGVVPEDLKMTRGGRDFTHDQNNAACASCHAKASPVTINYYPGRPFFDHFDLVTLESPDYYPDGRDLGENYTYTTWLLSPCVTSGQLDCLHCHTSSGRFRRKKDPNAACLPCHRERVQTAADHSHHPADSEGARCIACHMPMTEFARMKRSDHSMLPPTPAATIRFQSPNACNICHQDQDAAWADSWVRKWRERDYQAPVISRAELIDAARKRDWSKRPDMLAYLEQSDRDAVFTASLVRLLRFCPDESVGPALVKALRDPSPLVRSSAVTTLGNRLNNDPVAMRAALKDDYRLVRVRAAAAYTGAPTDDWTESERNDLEKATREYLAFLLSRPDQWTSHYNLGNYYLTLGRPREALAAYEQASVLDPRNVAPLVNGSMAYVRLGDMDNAAGALEKALGMAPGNAAVNYNLGLLRAEMNDPAAAETHLRAALKGDPALAGAAYNLCILTAEHNRAESLDFCRRAYHLQPDTPRFGFTLAYYLNQHGDTDSAVNVLETLTRKKPSFLDGILLLGELLEKQDRYQQAAAVYRQALETPMPPEARAFLQEKYEKAGRR